MNRSLIGLGSNIVPLYRTIYIKLTADHLLTSKRSSFIVIYIVDVKKFYMLQSISYFLMVGPYDPVFLFTGFWHPFVVVFDLSTVFTTVSTSLGPKSLF